MNGNKNRLLLRPLNPRRFRTFLAVSLLAGCCQFVHAEPIDFSHQIVPILREHCVACHGGDQAKGGFSINTRESFLDGQMAEPGNVEESYFLELISSADPEMQMPPQDRERVAAEQMALLRAWVRADMPWEKGFTFGVPVYEPPLRPRRPELPPVVEGRGNPVDRYVDAYLIQQGLPRPEPLGDAAFLRRVHLDLVGLLPEPDVLQAFLADDSPDKRGRRVRELLDDDVRYAEHWLTFWNDLLRNDYAGTGFITGGRRQISSWLYEALVSNLSFDQFARQLIAPPTDASRGYIDGIKWRGDVSAGQTVEIQFAQSISQSFLGINMKCASCHDSFIDRWTLHEAYGLAAIYASDPLQIHRCDKPTGETASASWLFPELGQIDPQASQAERLQQLAELMTHPKNGRFTRTVVNRLWHQLMGRGIVHPLDAMQTEPWNADLLDYLAWHLQENGYDLKQTLALIATSQAYQSIAEVVDGDVDPQGYTYRGPRAKRLTAEQFVDAIWQLTGSVPDRFDAPVTRGSRGTRNALLGESPDQELPLRAQWIWSAGADKEPPAAGETIAFRATLLVDRPLQTAGAVITCDNEYALYVNGQQLAKDTDWTSLEAVSLTDQLKVGENTILVIASNAGAEANPAGLLFEARIRYPDGHLQIAASGESWQALREIPPQVKSGKGPLESLDWQPIQVLEPVETWSKTIDPQVSAKMAEAAISCDLMVRASLLSSDFLMRSLGRPNRDQIVSTRPNELTTLEAIDLSNNETLAGWLLAGGERLSARSWEDSDPDSLVVHLFRSTLTRDPTQAELQIARDALGSNPPPQAIADVLWAICMTPDFLLVR